MAPNFTSPIMLGKIAIVVLGIIVMGVGLHSHFESDWKKGIYKVCKTENYLPIRIDIEKPCPSIAMERFYVAMVIIFFILSLAILALEFVKDMVKDLPLKMIDIGYHAIGGFFLFIGAILIIVSAAQIQSLIDPLEDTPVLKFLTFRTGEKIAAGALTIILSLLYWVVAFLAFRE